MLDDVMTDDNPMPQPPIKAAQIRVSLSPIFFLTILPIKLPMQKNAIAQCEKPETAKKAEEPAKSEK